MIIHPAEQNSLEWLAARAGVVTASELDSILTPEFAVRKGEMRKSYMCRKLAEMWIGPLPAFSSIDMEFGQILQDECLPLYALDSGNEVTRVGLCLTDDGRVGASPDGLIGDNGGIEAKCPRAETQAKYLLDNIVPKDYIVQVHAQLYVTGRAWWKFVSYHRHMPLLVVHVERDNKIIASIANALDSFLDDLDASFERLIEINGGPPKRPKVIIARPEPVMTEGEITP